MRETALRKRTESVRAEFLESPKLTIHFPDGHNHSAHFCSNGLSLFEGRGVCERHPGFFRPCSRWDCHRDCVLGRLPQVTVAANADPIIVNHHSAEVTRYGDEQESRNGEAKRKPWHARRRIKGGGPQTEVYRKNG